MFTNATVTITRRGASYDGDTGYREAGAGAAVLTDVRCVFSQNKSSKRAVNSGGIREYVKPSYSLLIPDESDVELKPGDQATVTPDAGPVQTFTLDDAVHTVGVGESHWECDIATLKVPA